MKFPYNSIDIANYILWKCDSQNIIVTHLKLQKLLYYVIAKHLQDTNHQLLDEPVSKWQYGPVVKSVYHQFKIFGDKPLEPKTYLLPESNYSGNGDFIIKFADIDSLNQDIDLKTDINHTVTTVINILGNLSPFELVERTHKEPAWKEFEFQILKGMDLTYSIDELRAANI